jgi:hypothetical protein
MKTLTLIGSAAAAGKDRNDNEAMAASHADMKRERIKESL